MWILSLVAAFLFAVVQSTPLVARQVSAGFSLYAQSQDTCLNGRFVAENSSTNFGSTLIILAPPSNNSLVIEGFLYGQPPGPNNTFFLVNQPLRQGGSEYDGWVVGPTNASGLAVPEIVPAGGTEGWSLVTSKNETKIAFERDGVNAKFFVCNRQLTATGDERQQVIFGFNAKKPKGCKKVQLIVSYG